MGVELVLVLVSNTG